MKLKQDFFLRTDVVQVAKDLLGKYLFTRFDNITTGGIITETEAYNGIIDKASHAYGDRRTKRTEAMYGKGGSAYIYLCYGIHSLFNVVTNSNGIPHAVLIRAMLPTHGINKMLARRKMSGAKQNFTAGPGNVSTSLGIHYTDSGISLLGNKIWIEDRGILIREYNTTPRIGVGYAKEDALLPYRFVVDHLHLQNLLDNSNEGK